MKELIDRILVVVVIWIRLVVALVRVVVAALASVIALLLTLNPRRFDKWCQRIEEFIR